jgi:hypothetical protein
VLSRLSAVTRALAENVRSAGETEKPAARVESTLAKPTARPETTAAKPAAADIGRTHGDVSHTP